MAQLEGASITREQFLLREMRIACGLHLDGITPDEVIDAITADNLFQYPTTRMVKNIAQVCVKRIKAVDSEPIERIISQGDPYAAPQANLYAMMCTYPLVRDFMQNEVARRFRDYDLSLGAMEMNAYFTRLMAEYSNIAQLTDATLAKLKQVLRKGLVACGMLESPRATTLTPIFADPAVTDAIRAKGDIQALPAFNTQEVE